MAVTSEAKPVSEGSIVVTSSAAGSNPGFGDIAYCESQSCSVRPLIMPANMVPPAAAKSTAIGLVRSGAVNLSASNIRVNGFSPGVTQTAIFANSDNAESAKEFSASGTEEEMKESYRAFAASKGIDTDAKPPYYYLRVSQPDEMADIGIFLASALSTSVNGHVIDADNGAAVCGLASSYLGPVPQITPLDV